MPPDDRLLDGTEVRPDRVTVITGEPQRSAPLLVKHAKAAIPNIAVSRVKTNVAISHRCSCLKSGFIVVARLACTGCSFGVGTRCRRFLRRQTSASDPSTSEVNPSDLLLHLVCSLLAPCVLASCSDV